MINVLGGDLGFGDFKYALGDVYGNIHKMDKEPTAVAMVEPHEHITDDRIFTDTNGKSYYVGSDALSLPTSSIIEFDTYEKLELFAPLMLYKVIDKLGVTPDHLVIGLSIAHLKSSSHFRRRIEEFFTGEGIRCKVDIVPQGLGCKLTTDKYGMNWPTMTAMSPFKNYVGADIGFNTLDIWQVIDGETSANLVRGLENRGIVVIAGWLQQYIQDKFDKLLTLREIKKCIDEGVYSCRGNSVDLRGTLKAMKTKYLQELEELIESEFGEVLDKTESLNLYGGGSYVFTDVSNEFYKVPTKNAEYYNAIGFYERGCRLAQGV